MIKTVQIKNFKSVVDLTLDLGTFNVFIGENGCGKTNILEAISFGAAANANKLDNEFLGSRGIRVTNPEFMFSAFTNGKKQKSIFVKFQDNSIPGQIYSCDITSDSNNLKKWVDKGREDLLLILADILTEVNGKKLKPSKLRESPGITGDNKSSVSNAMKAIEPDAQVANFMVYSPEQTVLRKFEETNQIYPLGINGAGLFQYLKELLLSKKSAKILAHIKDSLDVLDWYEDFELPDNLMSNEFSLKIKDRYLNEHLQYFDQKSTNEGFLFLLFYFTLFISKDTPQFFAIDNIDASLNPKLCMELTRNLAVLAKKHKKQVLVTTHNPAILDGLNLKDDNQRLFMVRRNIDGHTIANRVEYKPERKLKLSEIWTKGFIGGLPENF